MVIYTWHHTDTRGANSKQKAGAHGIPIEILIPIGIPAKGLTKPAIKLQGANCSGARLSQ